MALLHGGFVFIFPVLVVFRVQPLGWFFLGRCPKFGYISPTPWFPQSFIWDFQHTGYLVGTGCVVYSRLLAMQQSHS